jgi:hypothetical protein
MEMRASGSGVGDAVAVKFWACAVEVVAVKLAPKQQNQSRKTDRRRFKLILLSTEKILVGFSAKHDNYQPL